MTDILNRKTVAVIALSVLSSLTAGVDGAVAQTTRQLVTFVELQPDRIDEWLRIQATEVGPALNKAGVEERDVYATVVGNVLEYRIVRPLPSFGEFDEPDSLVAALGARSSANVAARLAACVAAQRTQVVTRQDQFLLDPGDAMALFESRYRANPGRSQDYMNFVRDEMYPVMRQARMDGTFAGLEVTVTAQGGEAGLITLNMFYDDFAPLDGPPPIAKTLGPEVTRAFRVKGAGLITPLEQFVLKRLPRLSF